MTDKLIDELFAELEALAFNWRMDWSGFDGRTLVYQISELIKQYRSGKIGTENRDEAEDEAW